MTPTSSATNLKIISTEHKPSGESVQLVRPLGSTSKSSAEIVGELVNRFDYKTRDVKANEYEINQNDLINFLNIKFFFLEMRSTPCNRHSVLTLPQN